MSSYSGKCGKGARRRHREIRRAEAEARQAAYNSLSDFDKSEQRLRYQNRYVKNTLDRAGISPSMALEGILASANAE